MAFTMTRPFSIHPVWLRGLCAFFYASAVSLIGFVIVGFYLPGRVMEAIWGPWDDQPLGSGFFVLLIAFPIGLLCLFACASLTRKLYSMLTP
jgi:hypothetical protein